MTTTTFQISSDELQGRIDAYYYQPKFRHVQEELGKSRWPLKTLNEIATIVCGSTPKEGSSITPSTDSVKFLKTINVQDFTLNLATLYYIPCVAHQRRAISALQENDVLLNIIGATLEVVGRVSIVPPGFGEANINQNIARIRIKEGCDINPFYLMGYLGTKLAQGQIEKLSRQAGQVNLNTKEVGLILVPIPSTEVQEKVARVVRRSCLDKEQYLTDIDSTIAKFDQEILTKFGLTEINNDSSMIFSITSDKLIGRIDAEYYRPIYYKLESSLTSKGKPLSDLAEFPNETIDPRKDLDKEFRYVEIENLDDITASINGYQLMTGREAPSRARLIIRSGDIIVPSLRGTFKKIVIVPPAFDGCVGTTGFLILKPKQIDRRYLYAILRSKIGQMQLERAATGAIMPTLTQSELSRVLIPLLDETKVQEIVEITDQFLNRVKYLKQRAETVILKAKEEIHNIIMEK
jgi:type I restriction enzyme S subunit